MADNFFHGLKEIWDGLLSRDVARIRFVYNSLEMEDQKAVITHLKRMANEPGWLAEQRISARAALEALASDSKQV
jgi:NADH:ubiquinone oxidoreductase subunit E